MRQEAYGQHGVTFVDRFGVYLSQRPVLNVLRHYQKPTVLDLGCGYQARLLHDILPMIGHGTGVDVQISTDISVVSQLTFLEQPIEQALQTLTSQLFDVIFMVSVLEHLWNPLSVITTCHSLLRPGGALVINVPNWFGKYFLELSAFKLGLSPAYEMDDHKMYYAKHELWPLLVQAGFKPSRIHLRYHKFGLNLFAVATKL